MKKTCDRCGKSDAPNIEEAPVVLLYPADNGEISAVRLEHLCGKCGPRVAFFVDQMKLDKAEKPRAFADLWEKPPQTDDDPEDGQTDLIPDGTEEDAGQ